MFYGSNEYEIWFDSQGAYATVEVEFVDLDGEDDCDEVELAISLYVSAYECSYYRPTSRDFEVEGVTVEAFGREYHFDLDEVISDEDARCRFMDELECRYAKYADECRAEMYL